jgi:hypothetical protein
MLSLWRVIEKQKIVIGENDRHFHRLSQSKRDVSVAQEDITNAIKRIAKLGRPQITPFAEKALHLRALWWIVERWEKAYAKLISTNQKMHDLYDGLLASHEQFQGGEHVNELETEIEKIMPQFAAYAKTCAAASEECAAASQEMNAQAEFKKRVVKELLGVEEVMHVAWPAQKRNGRISVAKGKIPKVLSGGK